jgi:hypothetical protein
LRRAAVLLVGLSLGSAGCSGSEPTPKPGATEEPAAKPISELVVQRVSATIAKPDPDAAYWRDVPRGAVTLMAQPMVAPRPETTSTDTVAVQAVYDGKTIAFRLVWRDPEKSDAGRLGEFSDALALQFPVKNGANTPIMMGAKDLPVHIYHWRAQYQRDKEKGKPEMHDLYPNMVVDMYPMDFKEAKGGSEAEKESFSPGRAAGNPQSYLKSAVDEIMAEGFSTSSVQKGQTGDAHGVWANGRWTLVITRPLAVEGASAIEPASKNYVALAAWQGGQGEVGSRKSVTMVWLPMKLQ